MIGSTGVLGVNNSGGTVGYAIRGEATTANDYAGYFLGKVGVSSHVELSEIADPAAAAANSLRLFARDNGSGKTQLCVRFPSGSIQVLATEP